MKYFTLAIILFIVSDISSQWYPDRHSTSVTDAWVSCQTSLNPNAQRGNTHWIMYDLGQSYVLGSSKIWNYNAPGDLNRGIQQAAVDISMDGSTWHQLGQYTFPKANASGFYEGFEGPDFGEAQARYILITAINNYGSSCTGLSEFKAQVLNSPLPVELLNFEGECKDKPVLKWSTAHEKNSAFFEIQYTKDAEIWTTISKIEAAGNSSTKKDYNYYFEESSQDALYFRLKQVDVDRRFSYSSILFLDCKNKFEHINIYPNPVKNGLFVQISDQENQVLHYRILDVIGNRISEGILDKTGMIQTDQLISGNYFIQIKSGDKIWNKEFIKI